MLSLCELLPVSAGTPYKNYSFFSGYEIFLGRAILGSCSTSRSDLQPSRLGRGKSSAPRGPVAATQRERILAAAERLIAEKGCAGTTIEGIVKAAGVSSVTFYEHFEDKEECFAAAFDRAVGEMRGELVAAVPAELPWPDWVRVGLAALLEAIDADPPRARMCLVEAQKGGPELRARYEAALDASSAVREGRADSLGSRSLEQAIVGGLAWLLRERLELGGGEGGRSCPRMTEIVLSPTWAHGGRGGAAASTEPARRADG